MSGGYCKGGRVIRLMVMLFVLNVFFSTKVNAQETIFDYLEQALTRVIVKSTLLNIVDYDYFPGNCLFGAYLSMGESQSLKAHFEKGVTYVVMAAGDDDIVDLDLELLSTSGEALLKDTDVDPAPYLEFTPNFSGQMSLKITNYTSINDGFCVMVILRESSSAEFSTSQLAEALDNVIAHSQIAYIVSSRFARNSFCLFGGRLKSGADTYIFNTHPQPGNYLLVGAGSDNIQDVDVSVTRQKKYGDTSGNLLAYDSEADNHPVCSFSVNNNYYYLLKHKNYASYKNSAGFVFSILLQQ